MVQIGAQDERAGEDGPIADDVNGAQGAASEDAAAADSSDPGPSAADAAGTDGTITPAAAPGLPAADSESTVILDKPGNAASSRPLGPSGTVRPDSPADLPSPDEPLAAESSGPESSGPESGLPRRIPAAQQPEQPSPSQRSQPSEQPSASEPPSPSERPDDGPPPRPEPFNVWARVTPAPLGSAAASPLDPEPGRAASSAGSAAARPDSPPGSLEGGTAPARPSPSDQNAASFGGGGAFGAAGPSAANPGAGNPSAGTFAGADIRAMLGTPASDIPGSPGSGSGGRRRMVVLIGVAAALALIVAGVGVYLSQKSSPAHAAGSGHQNKGGPTAAQPEHVVSVTPASGSTGVNGAATISVVFSQPLSQGSPMPTLKPALKGTWQVHGDRADFVPDRGYRPRTKVTLTIPGGNSGVRSSRGGLLAAPVTAKFRTGRYSTARIEQLLAQLGYLPLTWAAQSGSAPALNDARAQMIAAYSPPAGTYTWEPGYPAALHRLWKPDAPSQVLRGAVMAFQADHGLTSDMIYENQEGLTLKGSIVHRLWKALFRAATRSATNRHGYTYALANQHSPETLTVWHDGKKIFKHLANTGIPERPTAVRTDPVYIRYQSQIMRGTNPDGSKYADPVAWVAYFHGGEAVHYFPRYSYGFQQSLGCVELPWGPAKRIWPYLTYGTLVTVTKA